MLHRFAGIAGFSLLVIAPGVARADEPASPPGDATPPAAVSPPPPQQADDASRAAARRIAEEGLKLFDTGRYTEALARFEQAGAVVKAPTMALMAARSLEKLGRLVEASERYLAATRMVLDAGASDAFRTAQTDAAKEREALLPRIPSLTITLGTVPQGATVTLDQKPLAAALLDTAVPVNPGAHVVTVSSAGVIKDEPVQLKEGEVRRLVVSLAVPTPTASPLRTAGWIGLGVGGAGLVAGAVAGGILLSTKSRLDGAGCNEGKCPSASAGDVDTYNSLRPVTTGALAAGAALAAAGGLVLIFAPSSSAPAPARTGKALSNERSRATVQPFIGVGSAGLRGVF